MEAKALHNEDVSIVVQKRDLMKAWMVLEKLAVSMGDIGRFHGVPVGGEQKREELQAMLDDMAAFLCPKLLRELNQAREVLGQYLPDDETEHATDHEIAYWMPQQRSPRDVTA